MKKTQQIKLGDIVCDTQYQVRRKINSTIVNEYAEKMKNGAIFPEMVLEEKTNKIICGFTRYEAYKKNFSSAERIPVVFMSFKKKKDLLLYAAKSNNIHGQSYDKFDKTNIIRLLAEEGVSHEKITKELNWNVEFVRVHCGMVIVKGGGKKKPQEISDIIFEETAGREKKVGSFAVVKDGEKDAPEPLKRGLSHMNGLPMSKPVYENILGHYSGQSDVVVINQLLLRIDNGILNLKSDAVNDKLFELYSKLDMLYNKSQKLIK